MGLEELGEVAKLDARVETVSDTKFTVRRSKPLLVGYKALPFPETIVGRLVSSGGLDDLRVLDAKEFNRIKRK